MIERQEGFTYYTIAALRACVNDEVARQMLVPLENLLQRGKLVIGSVVDIKDNEVVLENGDAIAYDSLVIATGSASRFPVRMLWPSMHILFLRAFVFSNTQS